MKAKETKRTKTGKAGKEKSSTGCGPGDFQGMEELMSKCFTGGGGFPDCSTMMEAMKDRPCCGAMSEEASKDTAKEAENS
jgi:hypothetical protein